MQGKLVKLMPEGEHAQYLHDDGAPGQSCRGQRGGQVPFTIDTVHIDDLGRYLKTLIFSYGGPIHSQHLPGQL